MSRDQQRLQDYLAHILQAIERIDRYREDLSELDSTKRTGSGCRYS